LHGLNDKGLHDFEKRMIISKLLGGPYGPEKKSRHVTLTVVYVFVQNGMLYIPISMIRKYAITIVLQDMETDF
jgi:hypothetical protein